MNNIVVTTDPARLGALNSAGDGLSTYGIGILEHTWRSPDSGTWEALTSTGTVEVWLQYPKPDVIVIKPGAHSVTVYDIDGTAYNFTGKGSPPNFNIEWYLNNLGASEAMHTYAHDKSTTRKGKHPIQRTVHEKPKYRTSKLKHSNTPKVITNLGYTPKSIVDYEGNIALGRRVWALATNERTMHKATRFFKSKEYYQFHKAFQLRDYIVPTWINKISNIVLYELCSEEVIVKSYDSCIDWKIWADPHVQLYVDNDLLFDIEPILLRYHSPSSLRSLLRNGRLAR